MSFTMITAISKRDIERKIAWRKKQAQQQTLTDADENYNIKELKSTEHFEDEGK